ncbi:hypothetical protein BJ138DRAFT_997166 [Hygrophoropsis aurantiaca]|uniref:Uncharacterized protein n=1 Tax=Hygrophoropsis aurantiaca TaxID=72124 RepID=A0ACB8AQV8_9AGAM|nr:hypothetical protein BJ138DRAFT_997166 [Hygrophoropsis aurantiaca]
MIFAPPSPIVGSASGSGEPQSPIFAFPRADSPSASSVALSQMIFAPPSPTGPSNPSSPTYHQRFSSSSYASSLAPLEFAPPSPMSDIGKPPLPATPKPVFRRNEKPRFDKRSQSASPHPAFTKFAGPLPPTTNLLDANERADLIRRNRKLAQVFGQTPGAEMSVTDEDDEPRLFKILPQPALAAFLGLAKQRNHRHAMSVSVALKTPGHRTEPTSPWQVLDSPWSPGDRRYSTPLTPDSFTLYFDSTGTATDHHPYTASRSRDPQCHAGSQTSFIDLSDEDTPNDGASFISASGRLKKGERCHEFRYSTTAPSLAETLSPEAQFEAEKRRKRDKLAKLHRFLGSRVPTDLVVGAMAGPPLPPSLLIDTMLPEYGPRQAWMYRRRSGSALPSRSEPFDRVKQDLDGEEKALNVKRAHKMEKVFGTAPPQTLYHTRPLPSIPDQFRSVSPARVVSPSHTPTSPLPDRNRNQSAYTKLKGKRQDRPGTSESTKRLLSHSASISVSNDYGSGYQDVLARSSVYINYHQSLNSLIDIIDRDDRESLAELHRYLHGDVMDSPAEEEPRIDPRRASGSHSVRSERRHSLPTSMISISTEMTMPSAKPEATDFQLRRRRAAKLTNFFGVDYRELIDDVLESIEKGVEEERRRGTLEPEEVEVSRNPTI